jgi:hypothetical protein
VNTYTETHHVLQARTEINDRGDWTSWQKPYAGMFRPAELLADQGRLVEAIECAEKTYMVNYGNMAGIEFRVVTKITTVTTKCPPEESRLRVTS